MNRQCGFARQALAALVACFVVASANAAEPDPQTSYRDRIIAPQSLAPLPPDDEELEDTDGLPRSIRIELNVSQTERGEDTFGEQGVAAGGFWETPTWGSFSLDATLFHSNRDRFEYSCLRTRRMLFRGCRVRQLLD